MNGPDRKTERQQDHQALGDIAAAYAGFYLNLADHREAMAATCKWAIRAGYTPAACWVTTGMLAAKRPTHTLALINRGSSMYLMVLVGGVSISHELDVMYEPSEGVHAGWRKLDGEALARYREWAA